MQKIKWLDRTALVAPYLTLCTTEEQFKRAVQRFKLLTPHPWIGPQAYAATHTFVHPTSGYMCVVCIDTSKGQNPKPLERIYALLVHEAVHVKQALAESIGQRDLGDEVEAYAVQHISEQLMTQYKNLTRKGKK